MCVPNFYFETSGFKFMTEAESGCRLYGYVKVYDKVKRIYHVSGKLLKSMC